MSGVHNLAQMDSNGLSEPTNEILKEEGIESQDSSDEKSEQPK